jgi:hypothetical protein
MNANRAGFVPPGIFSSRNLRGNGLFGWTLNASIRTEYAAVACLRLQDCFTILTFIEEYTPVIGHRLLLLEAAVRAGEY